VEVEQAGCVAAAVPAPGLFLDDCLAALRAVDHSAPEVPPAGCSAPADSAADDSVPDDYSAPADSVPDEWVLDDYWAAPRAVDHSASEVRLAGCSAQTGSAADDSAQDDYPAPADSVPAEWVLDDYWAAPQAVDHSAPEVPPDGCSAPAELAADDWVRGDSVQDDCSEPADSVVADCLAAPRTVDRSALGAPPDGC